jgi:flavin reductase (DIM6/NTAB) family NADH-FMN oxidoreductase RutF
MVLSWLSATNNAGSMVFSINKSRYTASMLMKQHSSYRPARFTLCVPTKGMELCLLRTGSVSGRSGSKFRQDHETEELQIPQEDLREMSHHQHNMSKRQKRKLEKEQLSYGVPGLVACRIGTDECYEDNHTTDETMLAIHGTIAHLECSVTKVMDGVVDDQHLLVTAQVTKAFVQSNYWDESKNLFRPAEGFPPYMTFFGSQTLGYVVPN